MKDRVFLPLALALAAAMVAFALLPALERGGAPVEAARDGTSLHLDAGALAQFQTGAGFAVSRPPGPDGQQAGVRLAADEAFGPGAKGRGARLQIGPETRARIKDRPLTIVAELRRLEAQGSGDMAIGWTSGGPVTWVRAPVGQDFAQVRFDLPANAAPLALAVWPAVEGNGHGVEVRDVRIYGAAP